MARLTIVGEALLDVDLEGSATRLSPEAPVPVVDDPQEHDRPGGAALAAAMAAADGHDVVLVTPLGDDAEARRLRDALGDAVEIVAVAASGGTPVKRRVRAGGQNVVRLDSGGGAGSWGSPQPAVQTALDGSDAVLVSDYGRGLTRDPHCRDALERAARRVPVVWDPHPRGGDPVPGCLAYLPNEGELRQRIPSTDTAGDPRWEIASRAAAAVEQLGVRAVAVTLGERGALLSFGDAPPQLFAAVPASGDTCGAGDKFASTVAGVCATGGLLSEAVAAGVEAATRHVADGGAATFSAAASVADRPAADDPHDAVALAERMRARGGTVVAAGGCFDLLHAGHVAMLQAARSLGDALVVLVNSDESVRRLKGPGRPVVTQEDRARVLASLEAVDGVLVFDEDTPAEAIARIRPDVWVKGGDYAGRRLPEEDVMAAWGGRAVVVPYLSGRSTTALVRTVTTDHEEIR